MKTEVDNLAKLRWNRSKLCQEAQESQGSRALSPGHLTHNSSSKEHHPSFSASFPRTFYEWNPVPFSNWDADAQCNIILSFQISKLGSVILLERRISGDQDGMAQTAWEAVKAIKRTVGEKVVTKNNDPAGTREKG